MPFLGSALGLTAMCSLGWGNLVAFDWNDLPVGREFDSKFLKKVKSPPYALLSPPAGITLIGALFLWSRKPCFLSRTSSDNISRPILKKNKLGRNSKFLTKSYALLVLVNPFAKITIFRPCYKVVFIVLKALLYMYIYQPKTITISFR